MGEQAVEYGSADWIGVLTLNRPEQRNAMSPELLNAFSEQIEVAKNDPDIRCLIITGTGRCFSAGADLRSSLQRDDLGKPSREASYAMYEPFLQVLDVQIPVIAALNGHTVGGGFVGADDEGLDPPGARLGNPTSRDRRSRVPSPKPEHRRRQGRHQRGPPKART